MSQEDDVEATWVEQGERCLWLVERAELLAARNKTGRSVESCDARRTEKSPT